MKKVTFGGLTRDHETCFKYFDVFVDGHIGRYVNSVNHDSLNELENDLETQEED